MYIFKLHGSNILLHLKYSFVKLNSQGICFRVEGLISVLLYRMLGLSFFFLARKPFIIALSLLRSTACLTACGLS